MTNKSIPAAALTTPMCVLLFGLTVLVVYSPGLDIRYYADDYQFIFDTSHNAFSYFVRGNPLNGWYRPIEAVFLSLVQKGYGLDPFPIHVAAIFIHALLSYFVFFALKGFGYGTIPALLGSSFMVFSQANAFAVLSNDTLSQVSGTFFGCVSLWTLLKATGLGSYKKISTYTCISVGAFAMALLSKETSVSFFLILLSAILFHHLQMENKIAAVRQVVMKVSPYFAVLLMYLLIRMIHICDIDELCALYSE